VIQDASSPYCQAINRNPTTGEINDPYTAKILNANTGSLKTSGLDFAARYRFTTEFGFPGLGDTSSFDINSSFTWLNDFTSVPVAAIPSIQNHCEGSFGPTCGQPLPIWRGTTRVTWTTGPLGLSLRHRYIGPVTTDRYLVPLRQGSTATPALNTIAYPKLPSRNYFDLSFNYDVAKSFQLFGGANNVFNLNPPITTQGPSANTFSATYDVMGTEFFFGITAKF
jgi:outer membrane receptor protein involved in Fe transport